MVADPYQRLCPNDDAAVSIGFSSAFPRSLVVLDVPRESSRCWTVLSGSGLRGSIPKNVLLCRSTQVYSLQFDSPSFPSVFRRRFYICLEAPDVEGHWFLYSVFLSQSKQRCRTILSGRCCVRSCYGFPIAVVSGFLPSWNGPWYIGGGSPNRVGLLGKRLMLMWSGPWEVHLKRRCAGFRLDARAEPWEQ
jgi:hypothetical protein